MKSCGISVIIPVYNGERYLAATIESVLAQTYQDYELILVDDGSTDRSPAICDEYAARDSRIKVIHQSNGGAAHARDVGVQNAGDHTGIVFLDADDLFHPRMLEDMAAHEDADMVCTCLLDVPDSQMDACRFEKDGVPSTEQMSGKDMLRRLFVHEGNKGGVGALWGILFKKEFYRQIEPMLRQEQERLPYTYLEDVYSIPRFLFYAGKVTFLNRVYVLHRMSKNSISRVMKPNRYGYELPLANKLTLEFYKEQGCEYEYRQQLINFYLTTLKLWYQIVRYEEDLQKRREYLPILEQYYNEYYQELKRQTTRSWGEKAAKYSILLFRVSPLLWKLFVGDVRFRLLYRF